MIPSFYVIALIFIRSFCLAIFLPVSSGDRPLLRKSSIALILSCIAIAYSSENLMNDADCSVESVLMEMILGMILSLPLMLTIECALLITELADSGRGQQITGIADPLSTQQTSSLGGYARNIVVTSMMVLGIAPFFVALFLKSFETYPVAQYSFHAFSQYVPTLINEIISYLNAAIWFYIPVATLFLACDWCLALLNKLFPSFHVIQEAFLVKSVCLVSLLVILIEKWELTEVMIKFCQPFSIFR